MFSEIFERVNVFRNKSLKVFLFISFINTLLIIYFIYSVNNDKLNTLFIITFVSIFVVDNLLLLYIIVVNSKKSKKIQTTELIPYLLQIINNNWYLTCDGFIKNEELNSLMINRYGSFKSVNKVVCVEDSINYAFGYLTNIISTGQTSNDVFSGTYFTFKLPRIYKGLIQIRDKGRPSKYKKINLECTKYDSRVTEAFKEIKFYTNNPILADELIDYDLIQFYLDLKSEYQKGFYFTIINDKLVIGIHNRKNYFEFGIFEKLNQDKVNQRIEEFKKLERLINKICKFIENSEK